MDCPPSHSERERSYGRFNWSRLLAKVARRRRRERVRQYNFVGSILVNGRTTEVADRLAKETFRAADKVNRRPRQRDWSKCLSGEKLNPMNRL